jgi:hypothetical protein
MGNPDNAKRNPSSTIPDISHLLAAAQPKTARHVVLVRRLPLRPQQATPGQVRFISVPVLQLLQNCVQSGARGGAILSAGIRFSETNSPSQPLSDGSVWSSLDSWLVYVKPYRYHTGSHWHTGASSCCCLVKF